METIIIVITAITAFLVFFLFLLNIFGLFLLFKSQKQLSDSVESFAKVKELLDNNSKTVETNSAEQANALSSMVKLIDKEFAENFESLKKMQEFNEGVYTKLDLDNKRLYEYLLNMQGFLGKMAEGLGLKKQNNLEDI